MNIAMINLIRRRQPASLLKYYIDEITHSSCAYLPSTIQETLTPSYTTLKKSEFKNNDQTDRILKWKPLDNETFVKHVDELRSHRRKNGTIGFELGFSPPKSFSIAALAMTKTNNFLVSLHRKAVDQALLELSSYLFTRKTVQGKMYRPPVHPTIIRFTHFSNRRKDAHLHDHTIILTPVEEGAIDSYALYCHQRALRAIYHYILASYLLQNGIELSFDDEAPMLWEIACVPPEAIKHFSSRSLEISTYAAKLSHPNHHLARRIACLDTRKQLGKKDPLQTLETLRSDWDQIWKKNNLTPPDFRFHETPRLHTPVLADAEAAAIFSSSSVMTRLMVIGRFLSPLMKTGLPFQQVKENIDAWLNLKLKHGELKSHKQNVFCHVPTFRAETAILKSIAMGVVRKIPYLTQNHAHHPEIETKAITIRTGLVDPRAMFSNPSSISYTFTDWRPLEVVERINHLPPKKSMDLFVVGEFLEGEFLRSTKMFSDLRNQPKISLNRWEIYSTVFELATSPTQALDLVSGAKSFSILAGGDATVSRDLDCLQNLSVKDGTPLKGIRPLNWQYVETLFRYPHLARHTPKAVGILAKSRFDSFSHAKFYGIEDCDARGLKLKSKKDPLSLAYLEKVKNRLLLVEETEYRVVPGTRLRIQIGKTVKKTHGSRKKDFTAGEQVVISQILPDGSLLLRDNRILPANYHHFSVHIEPEMELTKKADVVLLAGITPNEINLEKLCRLNCKRFVFVPPTSQIEAVRKAILEKVLNLFYDEIQRKAFLKQSDRQPKHENFLGSRTSWEQIIQERSLKLSDLTRCPNLEGPGPLPHIDR